MKKILILLTVIISCITFNVLAVVDPTNEFYVNDYANILSEDTKAYIIEKGNELYERNGAQLVVVTVKSLDGYSIEEYANELFNNWGIGSSQKDNGLLLLLALNEREFRVEVGYGLEGILPDGKTGRFQDEYIIPYLKDNLWDAGIKSGFDAFFQEIYEYDDIPVYTPGANNNNDDAGMSSLELLAVLLAGCAIGFILSLISIRHYTGAGVIYIIYCFLAVFSPLLAIFFPEGPDIIIASPMLSFVSASIVYCILVDVFSKKRVKYYKKVGKKLPKAITSSSSGGSSHSSFSSHSSSHSSSFHSSGGGGHSGGGGSSRHF